MIKYPLQFPADAKAKSGIQTPWEAKSSSFPAIPCAIPHEFYGPGGAYSPEELFGLAAINCLIATFKVFAEKSSLSFEEISGNAVVIVDRPQGKSVGITQLQITLKVTGSSNREKALQLLEEAKKNCLVTSAMNVEKTYSFDAS
jgi:organic hydroperoxide reductase OsmC/OhrA